jgi:PilZ domain-containing protein
MSLLGPVGVRRAATTKSARGVVSNTYMTGRPGVERREFPHLFAKLKQSRPKPREQVPRAQRLTVRKPIFYRQVGQSQYHLAMLENISESGILLECHSQIPEGTNLEMIFEMPEEITGQPNSTVLCRGEVVRSTLAESSMLLVGVAISGYSIAGA